MIAEARTVNMTKGDPTRGQRLIDEIRTLPLKDGARIFPEPEVVKGKSTSWLGTLNRRYGMSGAWSQVMLDSWEKKGRLKVIRDGRTFIGVALPEDAKPADRPMGHPSSMKEQVLEYMRRKADDKGNISASTDQMRRAMGLNPHDFLKIVWDLQKQGIITFRQTGGSGASANLTNYRLRDTRTVVDRLARPAAQARPWSICPDCYHPRSSHKPADPNDPLIGDLDVVCPGDPKEGSPAWERKHARLVVDGKTSTLVAANDVPPQIHAKADARRRTWRCELCDPAQDFHDPTSLRMHTEAKHTPKPVAAAPEKEAIDWSAFPLLTGMVGKYDVRSVALAALKKTGYTDLIKELEQQIAADSDTALIDEVTLLLTTLGYEADLG